MREINEYLYLSYLPYLLLTITSCICGLFVCLGVDEFCMCVCVCVCVWLCVCVIDQSTQENRQLEMLAKKNWFLYWHKKTAPREAITNKLRSESK
jgi:hypothetical protein